MNVAIESEATMAVADRAYRAIRTRIMSGGLQGGVRLSESQLADTLGVSRTPVREALSRLHSEGLVSFERYRGARVAPLTDDDLREVYELRLLLEGMAAARAAEKIDDNVLQALQQNITDTEVLIQSWGDESVADFVDLNREFHGLIVGAAEGKRLKAIVTPLIDMPTHGRLADVRDPSFIEDALTHHSQIVLALRAGDPEWAKLQMQVHLARARSRGGGSN